MKHHDRELTLFLSSAVRLSLYRSSTVFHFVICSAVEKSLRFNSDSFSASVFFFFHFAETSQQLGDAESLMLRKFLLRLTKEVSTGGGL